MTRGFAVFTDNHVQQAIVDGLLGRGWDVVRAVDAFPEGTDDAVLLEHAAADGRVFVTNDEDLLAIAADWLDQQRPFPGVVYWHEEDYAAMTTGEIIRAFENLALRFPFGYPVRFVTPPAGRAEQRDRFKRRPRKRWCGAPDRLPRSPHAAAPGSVVAPAGTLAERFSLTFPGPGC